MKCMRSYCCEWRSTFATSLLKISMGFADAWIPIPSASVTKCQRGEGGRGGGEREKEERRKGKRKGEREGERKGERKEERNGKGTGKEGEGRGKQGRSKGEAKE